MFTLQSALFHLIEAAAVTVAIYLVTKRTLRIGDLVMLVSTITITVIVLDTFAPKIAAGVRHGAGFGLGYGQVAGSSTMNKHYYGVD